MAARVAAIAAGPDHCLALTDDGAVVPWGEDPGGHLSVPAGLTGVAAIAAGFRYNLALKSDGTVVGWGDSTFGHLDVLDVPAGLTGVIAIAAGARHSLALKSDGTVVAWGSDGAGETKVPIGLSGVTEISAGSSRSLALRNDGTVVAWGSGGLFGPLDPPAGLREVTAIATGEPNLALRNDGTVVAWGGTPSVHVPAGLTGVIAIAAGSTHSLALRRDGTVVGWGGFREGFLVVPSGLSGVTAIAAGNMHCLALTRDGSVAAWGGNSVGLTAVPAQLMKLTPPNQIRDVDDARFRAFVISRLRETEYEPWGDRNRALLVPTEVLIDLLLGSVPPSESDRVLAMINLDAKKGDRTARYEKLLIDHWTAAQMNGRMTSIADEVSASEIPHLILAGGELSSLLLLTAFYSSPRRIAIVNEVLNSQIEDGDLLAQGCRTMMELSFKELKGAGKQLKSTQRPSQTPTSVPKKAPTRQKSGGCYVATAVYGSYDCPEVRVLRRFRDQTLTKTPLGSAFVQFYYFISPRALNVAGPRLGSLARRPLDALVKTLKNSGFSDSPYLDDAEC